MCALHSQMDNILFTTKHAHEAKKHTSFLNKTTFIKTTLETTAVETSNKTPTHNRTVKTNKSLDYISQNHTKIPNSTSRALKPYRIFDDTSSLVCSVLLFFLLLLLFSTVETVNPGPFKLIAISFFYFQLTFSRKHS